MSESSQTIPTDNPASLTCTVALFRGLVDYCRKQSIAIEPILAVAQLDESELVNVDQRIAVESYHQAMLLGAELCGDSDFGLHYGEAIKPGDYGAVGLAAMSCETAGELLQLHLRFQSLVSDAIRIEVSDAALGMELRVEPKSPDFHGHRIYQEAAFASWLTMARWITGLQQVYPLRINFVAPEPPDVSEHRRLFGPNIYWQQPYVSVIFSPELRETRLPQATQCCGNSLKRRPWRS